MRISLLILISIFCFDYQSQELFGAWRDHLPYKEVHDIVKVNSKFFCATPHAIFSYEPSTGQVERFSKVNSLSDVGVSDLEYSEEYNTLFIGYTNGNLDMMTDNGIVNLSDIKRSNIVGDKGIYDIRVDGDRAWLSCGFGIVLINIPGQEVADTYIIGPAASNIKVTGTEVYEDSIYATTDAGVFIASPNSNLADFNNWHQDSGLPSIVEEYDIATAFADKFICRQTQGNLLLYKQNGLWDTVPGTLGFNIRDLSIQNDFLVETFAFGIRIVGTEFETLESTDNVEFQQSGSMLTSIRVWNDLWIGDSRNGLVRRRGNTPDFQVLPDGPVSNKAWGLAAEEGQVWVTHGGLQTNWDNIFNNETFSGFEEGTWFRGQSLQELEGSRDFLHVAVDPIDNNKVYFASWLDGLVELDRASDQVVIRNSGQGNADIDASAVLDSSNTRYQLGGLDFDPLGNLWLSNSYSDEPIKALKRDGEWLSFSCNGVSGSDLTGEIIYGDNGIVWVVLPRGEGLMAYGTYATTDDAGDDECKRLTNQEGQGGLPTNDVFCIAEDADGEIWIGTSEGPAVNYNSNILFTDDPADFQQILIEQDGNVEVLLGNQIIRTIAIDGANRKWFGTQNGGAFLMSEDGSTQLLHFTTQNSPLLSDEITDITIEPSTGEVFFATIEGVVSYVADATRPSEENTCTTVFPNPVREDYTGPITIDGMVADSEVTITDVAGNIVFQTVSKGGRAIWGGTDFSGNRVKTGVYFALTNSRDGETSCTAKILLIN